MSDIGRRAFLGRVAIAPVAATAMADAAAKQMAAPIPSPSYGVQASSPNNMIISDAEKAARRALRALDRRSDVEDLVWLDAMRSWSSATKVRAIREQRANIRAIRKPYERILGYLNRDDDD